MTEKLSPVEMAKYTFDEYAAMGAPELPAHIVSKIQVELARWQNRNSDKGDSIEQLALGVCDEAGGLAHAVLRQSQPDRAWDEAVYREAAGTTIACCAVYLMQCATHLRLDFFELMHQVSAEVMMEGQVE